MTIRTYPAMDAKIVGILRISDEPAQQYAAQRIAELEAAIDEARHLIATGDDMGALDALQTVRNPSPPPDATKEATDAAPR